ncbi:hypothetical protein F5X99DRAFT_46926 [Biscogniauxia marginata]|nr:hypothetical protein F5X99DRAFT_46926 [Biscogniauxia marginata]
MMLGFGALLAGRYLASSFSSTTGAISSTVISHRFSIFHVGAEIGAFEAFAFRLTFSQTYPDYNVLDPRCALYRKPNITPFLHWLGVYSLRQLIIIVPNNFVSYVVARMRALREIEGQGLNPELALHENISRLPRDELGFCLVEGGIDFLDQVNIDFSSSNPGALEDCVPMPLSAWLCELRTRIQEAIAAVTGHPISIRTVLCPQPLTNHYFPARRWPDTFIDV